jgi:hypothetical protein
MITSSFIWSGGADFIFWPSNTTASYLLTSGIFGRKGSYRSDIDHSNLFEPVFERHVADERTARLVVNTALDSLALDRAYRNALAIAMVDIPD